MNSIKEKYQKEAKQLLDSFGSEYTIAPVRSSYNRLSGAYAKTKNDLVKAFKLNYAMVQARYQIEANTTEDLNATDPTSVLPEDNSNSNPLLDD